MPNDRSGAESTSCASGDRARVRVSVTDGRGSGRGSGRGKAARGREGVRASLGDPGPGRTGERDGITTEEQAEVKRLKAENRRLREDVAILRAATTFFAGELDPRNR